MVPKVVRLSLLIVTTLIVFVEVKGEISSWFNPGQHAAHQAKDKATAGTTTPLHQVLNITKDGSKKAARDVSSAGGAASSSASSGTFAAPPPQPQPAYPPQGYPPAGYPYPSYGGGFFPGFGGGLGGGLDLALDAGLGGGIIGGIVPYFPIIEKVIVIVGGGILILIFLAIVHAFLIKGGLVGLPGLGLDASAAKSFAGAVDVDAGPFHASNSIGGSLAFDKNIGLTQQHVMKGINTRW